MGAEEADLDRRDTIGSARAAGSTRADDESPRIQQRWLFEPNRSADDWKNRLHATGFRTERRIPSRSRMETRLPETIAMAQNSEIVRTAHTQLSVAGERKDVMRGERSMRFSGTGWTGRHDAQV